MQAEGCGVLLDAISVKSELRGCACGSHQPPRREKVFWFAIEIQMTMAIQPEWGSAVAHTIRQAPPPPPPQTPSPPPPSPPVLLVNERRPNEPRRSSWKHLLPVAAAGRHSPPATSPQTLPSTRHDTPQVQSRTPGGAAKECFNVRQQQKVEVLAV